MGDLGPWFSAVTVGAPADGSRAPSVVEEPDHATVLTWRLGAANPYDIVILGPRTRAGYFAAQPARSCVQMRFRPGRAAELLGVPARQLADRAVPATDLDSGPLHDLIREIVRAGPAEDRLHALARDLPAAGPADWRSRIVAEAAELLPGERVAAVAQRLNVSERHLRNLFTDRVGLGPAMFVRINRLRKALAGMDRRLPALAAEAGYYDQSHMNADFRQLMGTTPHAFATRRWPGAAICTG